MQLFLICKNARSNPSLELLIDGRILFSRLEKNQLHINPSSVDETIRFQGGPQLEKLYMDLLLSRTKRLISGLPQRYQS